MAAKSQEQNERPCSCDQDQVGYLPLDEGQTMMFVYDFGTDWQFTVKLEKIKPPDDEFSGSVVVESHGKAPAEYDDNW